MSTQLPLYNVSSKPHPLWAQLGEISLQLTKKKVQNCLKQLFFVLFFFIEKNYLLLQKLEKELPYNSSLLGKEIESRVLKRRLFINLHSSIIHRSQKVEAAEHPLKDEWKNKV